MQQILVVTLAVVGTIMTVLIGALAVFAVGRGLIRRRGLGENRPEWEGCPSAWKPLTGDAVLTGGKTPWPEGDWQNRINEAQPRDPAIRPHCHPLETGGSLLFLPGRSKGVTGWWVVLLHDEND